MQAIMVSEFGGPEVLQPGEAPRPEPRAGDVLVRVIAAGVGPGDVTLRRGGWTGSLPYIPGGSSPGMSRATPAPISPWIPARRCTAIRA